MTNTLRTIYRYWTLLVALAVILQVGFAAYGAFYSASKLDDQTGSDETNNITEKVFGHGFDIHRGLGYIIFLAALILFLLALGAGLGRPRIWWNLALPILVAVQIALFAWGGYDVPVLGFFHGVNALVIAGLAGALASREWRRASPADAATGTAPAPR
jgi:heme A synthase